NRAKARQSTERNEMTDDDLLPDWDRDDDARRAGLDARLCDMLRAHLADYPLWQRTAPALADDLTANDEVLTMLSRVSVLVDNLAILAYGGRQEAIDALTADLAQLRRIAMKGAGQ